jgi:hypothetical protein
MPEGSLQASEDAVALEAARGCQPELTQDLGGDASLADIAPEQSTCSPHGGGPRTARPKMGMCSKIRIVLYLNSECGSLELAVWEHGRVASKLCPNRHAQAACGLRVGWNSRSQSGRCRLRRCRARRVHIAECGVARRTERWDRPSTISSYFFGCR